MIHRMLTARIIRHVANLFGINMCAAEQTTHTKKGTGSDEQKARAERKWQTFRSRSVKL